MERGIVISSEAFRKFLENKGFVANSSGNELVYERVHDKCKSIYIRVYTSIRVGNNVSREVGKDAIRVIAYYSNGEKSFGIAGRQSLSRVYRTGTEEKVFERTLERMREAYRIANEWLSRNSWARD